MSNDKLKIKEIKTFTAQDMIDFAEWLQVVNLGKEPPTKPTKEILQLWEQQRVLVIKSTSELGCMLDTERPWVSVEDKFPSDVYDVQVLLKDNSVSLGWFGIMSKKWQVLTDVWPNIQYGNTYSNNPVVAWRELQ